jgi:hypothetical protein
MEVFQAGNFNRKYFLVQSLGGAVLSGQSFIFKKKENVHLISQCSLTVSGAHFLLGRRRDNASKISIIKLLRNVGFHTVL